MMCVILIYLLIDFGSNAGDIISLYAGLQQDSKTDFPKSLQFLRAYTQKTGDITLALNTGMTKEEIDEMLEEGNPNDDSDIGIGGGGGGPIETPDLNGDLSNQVATLKNSGTYAAYYGKVLNVTSGYYWELQSGAYNKIYAGTVGNTIGGAGCFVYAICQAKSNLSGTVFTTVDLVNKINNNNVTISGNVVAGNSTRSSVGQGGSGFTFADAGLSVTQLSSVSDIGPASSNELYVIYGYSKTDKTGTHWRVCTGKDSSGNYFILPNVREQSGLTVSASQLSDIYTKNASSGGTRIYKVTL